MYGIQTSLNRQKGRRKKYIVATKYKELLEQGVKDYIHEVGVMLSQSDR